MVNETRKIDSKTPGLKIESIILQLYFIHKKFEGDALNVAKIEKINMIRGLCLKYNYKWIIPRKKHFNNLLKNYKYFINCFQTLITKIPKYNYET